MNRKLLQDLFGAVVLLVIAALVARVMTPADKGYAIYFGVMGSLMGVVGMIGCVWMRKARLEALEDLRASIAARANVEKLLREASASLAPNYERAIRRLLICARTTTAEDRGLQAACDALEDLRDVLKLGVHHDRERERHAQAVHHG